ncbi:hypothetical protein J2X69_002989 [Algoriphagus sp. 4150]|uniref:WG repeat-containing protein n=1 Tax=Algoriphagus sp. 4150 TaxID=2817756 RepID=UPI00286747B7|nr:WG repeat-containing protein [Algoriphagus sp. 4150]MDR7130633.1 hypothetical protein [Algoriphagus sp. 4150]
MQYMRTLAVTCILLLIGTSVYAQQGDFWIRFWDDTEENFGFKDESGQIVIQPKFGFFSYVNRLEHVFIASEFKDWKLDIYYLTKSGNEFGRDSIYSYDNTPDCESEGFIRFRDRKTDKVGMFDRNGEVVIPAVYDDLSQVKNGLVTALKDKEKKFWEEHNHSGCEHFSWTGGKTMLIDTANSVLIDNFTDTLYLDLYSHLHQDLLDEKPNREYFPGVDGGFHSFVNYETDFSLWLDQAILDDFSLDKLKAGSADSLVFWKEGEGWVSKPSDRILEDNFLLIKDALSLRQIQNQDFFISINGLNQGIFEAEAYNVYFDNCGQALTGKYPLMSVIISHKNGDDFYQNHFDFLKTEEGYRLVSITLRSGMITD